MERWALVVAVAVGCQSTAAFVLTPHTPRVQLGNSGGTSFVQSAQRYACFSWSSAHVLEGRLWLCTSVRDMFSASASLLYGVFWQFHLRFCLSAVVGGHDEVQQWQLMIFAKTFLMGARSGARVHAR